VENVGAIYASIAWIRIWIASFAIEKSKDIFEKRIQTEYSKLGKNEEYLSYKREVLSLEVNIKKNDSSRKSKAALN